MKNPPSDTHAPFHILLGQASRLVRGLQKASRSDAAELRDQARLLVHTLDTTYPEHSSLQQILALVRSIADSDDSAFNALRRQAQDLLRERQDSGTTPTRLHTASTSTRDVDAWILDMFRSTESAIPREVLVDEFVQRYRRERRIADNAKHLGPWLFVFETVTEQGRVTGIRPLVGAGLHPTAFQDRCREFLPGWAEDPFLPHVLQEQRDIELWYALLFNGSPLFDNLIDTRRNLHGEPNYWVNAVSLPGDSRHETRAVFTLYRNTSDPLFPEPAPGMKQDMRLLTVLALAWRQLEHQVRALARISEADRRDMINLIAPGLLHHEIGFNMRTAYGQAYEQFHLLKRIAHETGNEDIELATRYAHGIAGLVLNLYRITDAFNNLDKRGQVEASNLNRIFSDLRLLLHHRLGDAHTELVWDQAGFEAQSLRSDVVLLSQALINLINNALNALIEGNILPPRCIRTYLEQTDEQKIVLCLINNGPGIPSHEVRDIVRRGYTTRTQGHGQGLYLARLVSHYLGGDLTLMEQSALPEGFHVGFRLTFNRKLSAEYGVARAND